jgi:putative ABC transport system permease protein
MIRHLLKMVWNRKAANALIGLEILVSFLVLFAVSAMGVYQWRNYRQPLGFDWRPVWSVKFRPPRELGTDYEIGYDLVEPLVRGVAQLDFVDGAAVVSMPLYSGSGWGWSLEEGDRTIKVRLAAGDDGLQRVMGLEIVRGRWFNAEDDVGTDNRRRGVISQSLAREYFGDDDPIGGRLRESGDDDFEIEVVGVMTDYRYRGELSAPTHMAIVRALSGSEPDYLGSIAVRVRPGTTAAAEETILERLHALAPSWSFEVEPAAAARERYFRERLAPLLIAGLVAGFLLLMVALGLVGVLWQAVTQRTAELGVRRAQGANPGHVLVQIQGELLVLTTLALGLGTILVAQVPLIGWFPKLTGPIFLRALGISGLGMLVLAALAGLYPSWMATRIEPAHALHYE